VTDPPEELEEKPVEFPAFIESKPPYNSSASLLVEPADNVTAPPFPMLPEPTDIEIDPAMPPNADPLPIYSAPEFPRVLLPLSIVMSPLPLLPPVWAVCS
jgi:hypothetical protein